MTLSRKAIRPAQTRYLLANGFLPVSIDYRLCPEVSMIEGPIADVCSAYAWAKTRLPALAAPLGLKVDATKVVAVGWSSGGHLAVSLGWTARDAGMEPPSAILSFYAPYDFESGGKSMTYGWFSLCWARAPVDADWVFVFYQSSMYPVSPPFRTGK